MKMLRACYDWRVLAGLAALGVGVYVVAPRLVAAAFPLLFLAACPLSMLVMMKTMTGRQHAEPASDLTEQDPAVLRRELALIERRQQELAAKLAALEDRRTDGAAETLAVLRPVSARNAAAEARLERRSRQLSDRSSR